MPIEAVEVDCTFTEFSSATNNVHVRAYNVGLLLVWLVSCLLACLVSLLVAWLIGWLVACLLGCLFVCLVGWLVG